jgi:hypothetical protein
VHSAPCGQWTPPDRRIPAGRQPAGAWRHRGKTYFHFRGKTHFYFRSIEAAYTTHSQSAQSPRSRQRVISPTEGHCQSHNSSPYTTSPSNTCPGEGTRPLKSSQHHSLFNKGYKSTLCNYRPVSLALVRSNVLVHMLHHHIIQHMDHNLLLSGYQHGFQCQKQKPNITVSIIFQLGYK